MSDNSFKKARLDYNIGSIDFNNIIDPIKLFRKWFDEVYQIDKEEAVSMNFLLFHQIIIQTQELYC